MMSTEPLPINDDWEDDLSDLSAAEEFLSFFGVEFDESVVQVNRLHILQRFHDYLTQVQDSMPEGPEPRWNIHRKLLDRAYADFVESDAITEKVFKVFHSHGDCNAFVSVESLKVIKS